MHSSEFESSSKWCRGSSKLVRADMRLGKDTYNDLDAYSKGCSGVVTCSKWIRSISKHLQGASRVWYAFKRFRSFSNRFRMTSILYRTDSRWSQLVLKRHVVRVGLISCFSERARTISKCVRSALDCFRMSSEHFWMSSMLFRRPLDNVLSTSEKA